MMNSPQGSVLLIFTQMWESFSYYGMRTLLVLFMIKHLGYQNADAIGVYALYATLANLGGLLGGYCGDQIFGLKQAVIIGGLLIALGHICLSIPSADLLFYLGLSCIICGTSLFGPSLKALFGRLYDNKAGLRESAYTLYYAGINLGGFSAAILCGYIAQAYGWHAGFGLAAIGMMIGLCLFFQCRRTISQLGSAPACTSIKVKAIAGSYLASLVLLCTMVLQHHNVMTSILPTVGALSVAALLYQMRAHPAFNKLLSLGGFILLYMLFFAVEELMSTVLIIYCENNVDRHIGDFEVPSTALVAINPLTVIIFGSLLANLLRRTNQTAKPLLKMNSIAFMLLGGAFSILLLGNLATDELGQASIFYVIASFALIALGELLIAPPLFAFCSQSMPRAYSALAMGLITVGRSYASLFSGIAGKEMTGSTIVTDTGFFGAIAAGCAAIGLCLLIAGRKKSALSPGTEKQRVTYLT